MKSALASSLGLLFS
jgi:C1A family cysteine protease